jgi:hypothetical protein
MTIEKIKILEILAVRGVNLTQGVENRWKGRGVERAYDDIDRGPEERIVDMALLGRRFLAISPFPG